MEGLLSVRWSFGEVETVVGRELEKGRLVPREVEGGYRVGLVEGHGVGGTFVSDSFWQPE